VSEELVMKSINAIRFLAIDGVEKANSGHPGLPMGCAPMTYVLFRETMKFNPKNPQWFNRDRFVLSAGHGSMLQYAMLHLCGYDSVTVRVCVLWVGLGELCLLRRTAAACAPPPRRRLGRRAAAAAVRAGADAANARVRRVRRDARRRSRTCSSSASGSPRLRATRRTS
jgi:hypothetical protein